MYEIAAQVSQWVRAGRAVHVAQIVATRGFSSRDQSAALAWTDDGDVCGALFPVVDVFLPAAGAQLDGHLAEVDVSDADAVAAGLSCGGVATVAVYPATALPARLWTLLERHEPVCLVSVFEAQSPAVTKVFTRSDVRDAVRIDGAHDVPRLFARGTSSTSLTAAEGRSVVAVALWPATELLVVGNGLIADALADTAALLGWTCVVTDSPTEAAEAAARLTEADAAVVLSHDRDVDVPALAAVLSGRAGYVGALGSRGTQAARRDGLLARAMDESVLARIHGPAGLDVDAHTPAEIAVSIAAEILAVRSGTSGGSISRRGGPVHSAGVHAPPPRY